MALTTQQQTAGRLIAQQHATAQAAQDKAFMAGNLTAENKAWGMVIAYQIALGFVCEGDEEAAQQMLVEARHNR